MANLVFYYGTMESGKTTKLLQDHFNYSRHNINVVVLKPKIDSKGGDEIVSRMGESLKVDLMVDKNCKLLEEPILDNVDFILVDEAQFFTEEQIRDLWCIAHERGINVIAYGLRSNFMGKLFDGSAALFGIADEFKELTVSCLCGNTANFNARRVNGVFVSDGAEVVIDGAIDRVEYIPLCSDCYYKYVEEPSREKKNSLRRVLKYKKTS